MDICDLKDSLEKFFLRYRKQITVKDLMRKLDISYRHVDLVLDCLYALEKEGKLFCDKNSAYMHVPDEFCYKFGELMKSNSNQFYVNLKDGCRVSLKKVRNAKVGDYVFVSVEKGKHPKSFNGSIERVVRRTSWKGNISYIVKGILMRDGNHFFIRVGDNRVYISPENLNTAFVGDVVNVRICNKTGNVIEILKRHHDSHVFKCVSVEGKLQWIPVGIPCGSFSVLQDKYVEGDMVIASIVGDNINIIDKLNPEHNIFDDINALILDYGFANKFNNNVLDEAKRISSVELSLDDGRVDLRNLETFTIDPIDAKDLDDAVSLVCDGDIYHLYVHIANPTYYIKMNSSIFQEAFRRGFSVYPVNGVIPMLPDVFSSGVCSLNESGDKYAISCRLDIDKNGNVVDFDLFKSIINSNKQMNYTDVNKFLENWENKEYLSFKDTLIKMRELASLLEKKRIARGALSLDSEEKNFVLDEFNNPIAVVETQRGEAELIIENFMLAANERIAQYASDLGLPYIYRNHEKPTVQKENSLKTSLIQNGYFVQKIGNIEKPEILQQFLNNLLRGKSKEERKVICEMVLKTMTRAYYDYDNNGHYGLALECYGTFTSPARKISDLINHMIIEEFLDSKNIVSDKMNEYRDFIGEYCDYISSKQKDADMLEQEIARLMLNKYADKFIDMEVKGRILFANRYGVYVKDENGLTGVILYRKNVFLRGSSIMVNGVECHVNEQVPVVLKSRGDYELYFEFGDLKEKKLVKSKKKSEVV